MRPFGRRIAVIRVLRALLGLVAGSVCPAAAFTGTVTGPDQQAVSDANVWLIPVLAGSPEDLSAAASGEADPAGASSLADPADVKLASPAHWRVLAYREGLTLDGLHGHGTARPPEPVLRDPSTISARVLGDQGGPLVGAPVELVSAQWGADGQPELDAVPAAALVSRRHGTPGLMDSRALAPEVPSQPLDGESPAAHVHERRGAGDVGRHHDVRQRA